MVAAIDDALAAVGPGQTLIVATHGGSARAAIGALLELPPDHWASLGVLSNCAWSVLVENVAAEGQQAYGPAWRLQEYNAGTLPVPALADDR
jgi:probable phosphoglycerate mutase